MIEVFKTNVKDHDQANLLLDQIHQMCVDYKANFDLTDCDKILRIKCSAGLVEVTSVITLLNQSGYNAEILPEEDHMEKGFVFPKVFSKD